MKKIPFYLVFFALDYCLTKFLPLQEMFLLLLLFILLGGVFFLGSYFLTRNFHRAGFLSFLGFIWAFYFGTAAHIVQSLLHVQYNLLYLVLLLLPWTLAFYLMGSNWLWHKIKSPEGITAYLNVLTLISVVLFGYRLLFSLNYRFIDPPVMPINTPIQTSETRVRPDIYYIILDGYGREDILQEYLQFDNSQFIDFLESRGFYVAEQSQANYLRTIVSVSSSLNMNYLNPTNKPIQQMAFIELFARNQTRSYLSGWGYQFISFYTPYIYTDIKDADIYFPLMEPTNMRARHLLETITPGSLAAIPLEAEAIFPSGSYSQYQDFLISSFEQLSEIPYLPGSKFVFFHVLAPHPPFIFDQNGPITPDRPYLLVRDFRGTQEERIAGYIGQVSYLNWQVENAIDAILANSSVPPIIVIQGDHGPGFYFGSTLESTCLRERTSILNAYYLPGLSDNPLYETITPVNTFRVIFNQYFGAGFDLLDDRVYYNGNGESFNFVDVTGESQTCVYP